MHNASRTLAASLALLLTGCANYDFAKARRTDGTYDFAALIAELDKSGKNELSDGVWIPLIHMDVTTFKPAEPGMPEGYALSEMTASGPLFLIGSVERTCIDKDGKPIERIESDWVGWGALYFDREQRIETSWGTRRHSRHAVLLIFGGDHTHYGQAPAPAESKQPAESKPSS